MIETCENPWRGRGLAIEAPSPLATADAVARLLAICPAHAPTPLHDCPALAARAGVAQVHVKDERGRMGLGSFKALGAAHAIARQAADSVQDGRWDAALTGRTYVTASAGNHGLSVAAGASLFGARAVIYLAETVPAAFAARLQAKGAQVMRAGATYEDSMAAAEAAAQAQGWTLLSDSSWPGYTELPLRVMEGYLQLAAEVADQIDRPPTHILLQAGVGGLAAAVAAHRRGRTRRRAGADRKHPCGPVAGHKRPPVQHGAAGLQDRVDDRAQGPVARCGPVRDHQRRGSRGRCGGAGRA